MKHQPPYPYAFFEGKIVKIQNAKVSIMIKGIQYGQALFAGIKGYYDPKKNTVNIFRLKDHYQRMVDAVNIVPFSWKMNFKDFEKLFIELTKKNKVKENCYYRPNVYSNDPTIVPIFTEKDDQFSLYMIPMGDYLDVSKGVNLMVSSWTKVADNMISTKSKVSGMYVNSSLAKYEAVQNGYDDAIMLNPDGSVSEGSAANIFGVKDGVVFTPPLGSNNLAGIARRTVIKLLKEELGTEVKEQKFDRSQLYTFDELFISGTASQVVWIKTVDKRTIGKGKIGPITKQIKDLYFEIVKGKNDKYSYWLTKIKL
ncbi:MAG: branched-chain amino acid transaminase [Candidatus Moranbacteria bacterium]|nr:branched-chain amino acid transaminase [Candidatus Moranbacteria bacterium]